MNQKDIEAFEASFPGASKPATEEQIKKALHELALIKYFDKSIMTEAEWAHVSIESLHKINRFFLTTLSISQQLSDAVEKIKALNDESIVAANQRGYTEEELEKVQSILISMVRYYCINPVKKTGTSWTYSCDAKSAGEDAFAYLIKNGMATPTAKERTIVFPDSDND